VLESSPPQADVENRKVFKAERAKTEIVFMFESGIPHRMSEVNEGGIEHTFMHVRAGSKVAAMSCVACEHDREGQPTSPQNKECNDYILRGLVGESGIPHNVQLTYFVHHVTAG